LSVAFKKKSAVQDRDTQAWTITAFGCRELLARPGLRL
jgi:hypothetical protein